MMTRLDMMKQHQTQQQQQQHQQPNETTGTTILNEHEGAARVGCSVAAAAAASASSYKKNPHPFTTSTQSHTHTFRTGTGAERSRALGRRRLRLQYDGNRAIASTVSMVRGGCTMISVSSKTPRERNVVNSIKSTFKDASVVCLCSYRMQSHVQVSKRLHHKVPVYINRLNRSMLPRIVMSGDSTTVTRRGMNFE